MSDPLSLGTQYGWVGRDFASPELQNQREYLSRNNGIPGLEVLTPERIEDAKRIFYRDGFVVVRDALTQEQLMTIRNGCARVISEIMDAAHLPAFLDYDIDCLQVGARNMQNFELLKKLGSVERPILLKRGISATFEEWLMAAEYLLAEGNSNVILCERGVRTFNNHSRNTLDLNIVPLVRKMTHLPVVVDPSHGVGKRDRVRHLARAGIAAGAHGLMMEVHTQPDTAYSDAQQTIDIGTFSGIVKDASILVQLENLFGTDKEQS